MVLTRQLCFSWLLALIVLGYPISSLIGAVVAAETSSINYFLRALVFTFGLLGIFWPGISGRYRPIWLLLTFFVLYFIRLFYDTYFAFIPDASYALSVFIVMTVVPSLGLFRLALSGIDYDRVAYFFLFPCALGLFLYYLAISLNTFSLHEDSFIGSRIGFIKLGPIALGHLGVTSLICSFLAINVSGRLANILCGIIFIASLPLIFNVGSRGPIVALIVCVLLISLRNGRLSLWLFCILTLAVTIFSDSSSIVRIADLANAEVELDLSGLARLEYQAAALESFLNYPLAGEFYIDPALGKGKYPHNIIIEAAMALGLLGLLPLLCIILTSLWRIVRKSNQIPDLIALLYLQYLINSMLSANLWGGSDKFWALSGLILLFEITRNVKYKQVRFANSSHQGF